MADINDIRYANIVHLNTSFSIQIFCAAYWDARCKPVAKTLGVRAKDNGRQKQIHLKLKGMKLNILLTEAVQKNQATTTTFFILHFLLPCLLFVYYKPYTPPILLSYNF